MELIRLFASIAVMTFAGWGVLNILFYKKDEIAFPQKLFISYGLGAGMISLEMLFFYMAGLGFSLVGLLLPWIAVFIINVALYIKPQPPPQPLPGTGRKASAALNIFLISGIIFEVLYAAFRALIKPLEAYDAVAIYAIKSKIFYLAGSVPGDLLGGIVRLFPHPDYPLNIPLTETFIYLFLGGLNDQLVKIIFPLYFIAILGTLYYGIRRFANSTYALLFTFLLASVPQFNAYAANGYLDLVLAYYVFSSFAFFMIWLEDRKDLRYIVLSALMAGLAGWTKNEGLMYCLINTLLIIIVTAAGRPRVNIKKLSPIAVYLCIIAVMALPWLLVKRSAGIANSEIDLANINPSNLIRQINKIPPIIYEFQKQFFGPKKWNIIWPVAAFVAAANYRKAFSGPAGYAALFVSMAVSGYIVFYMVSYVDINFFVGKTWSRFLLHFLPVVVYWMALVLKDEVTI